MLVANSWGCVGVSSFNLDQVIPIQANEDATSFIVLPGIEVGIALSACILGIMVFAEARPPLWAAATVVSFFAIFHGHAHGTALPPGSSGSLYSIGFVVATGALHLAGIGVGLAHRWESGKLAIRGAGLLIALSGIFFLWRALT